MKTSIPKPELVLQERCQECGKQFETIIQTNMVEAVRKGFGVCFDCAMKAQNSNPTAIHHF